MFETTTICSGLQRYVSTIYGGQNSKFGFVANFSADNEVGIDENISVGYKGEIIFAHNQFRLFVPGRTDLLSAIYILCRP